MESPRAAYAARNSTREQASMKLMTALDAPRVELIKRDFELRNNQVDPPDFISIMLTHLPSHLYSDHDHAADELLELFKEVDVNGDGTMDWEELTRFMVSKAALMKSTAIDAMLPYHHNTQIIGSAAGPDFHHRHRDSIDGICNLPRLKQFAVIENHSPVIAVYNARNASLVATMKCKAVPLCVCYVEPLQSIIACCSDSTMTSFNVGESASNKARYQQKSFWATPDAQMAMCWQPTHNLLYSGSVGGRVHAWDVEKREQRCCFESHTDIVMDVLNLDCLDSIVSASLDTNIIVVDSYTEQQTARLSGHSKGVNSLCYNADHRFLISSGFDHDVFVWSPFVSTLLYKLKGHRAALVGCETVEGTPELITADASGVFKLWDCRNLGSCVQTFTSEHEPGDLDDLTGTLSCFKHVKLPCASSPLDSNAADSTDDFRIITASKKLLYFDQERMRANPVSDEGPIRVLLFNSQSLTIFTGSERTVKIWDAILGSVKYSFKNITATDISAACLDDRQRKFIVGESSGEVSVFNYQNGALMKSFTPQGDSPVINLAYCAATKSVMVAYLDSVVRVYDESDIESCKVLRTFDETYSHRGDLYCAVHDPATFVVATGGTLHSEGVRLWDYDSGKCDLILKTGDSEVVALAFLGDYPLLAVGSADSRVRIYGIHQSHLKGACVAEWINELPAGALITSTGEEAADPGVVQSGGSPEGERGEGSSSTGIEHRCRRQRALGSTQPHATSAASSAAATPEVEGSATEQNTPEFVPVMARKRNTSPVSSLAWDPIEECLFTGSEGGQLRKWGLARLVAHLNPGTLEIVEMGGRRRVRVSGGNEARSLKEIQGIGEPSSLKETASLVDFRWGLEMAHEADVTVIVLTQEPRALLSASTDKRVQMFSLEGDQTGVLLQSTKHGMQSSQWSLKIDVALRQASEAAGLSSVLKAKAEREDARMTHGFSHASSKHTSDTRGKRKGRGAKGRPTGKDASRAGQSATERTHKRVLDVLAKVKNVKAGGGRAAEAELGGGGGGDNAFQTTLVGNPKLREKNRRLPPHLKAVDPIASPPIELTGLGPGFEQGGGQTGQNSTRLPHLSHSKASGLGRSSDAGEGIIEGMKRLNTQFAAQSRP